MPPNSLLSERESARRRRKLRWVLENAGGRRRRRLRSGGSSRPWQWLTQGALALLTALALLGVVYEFFC